MARIDSPFERLTECERAICYYTLPKVVHPLTLGLLCVYTLCLFESVGILVYGVVSEQDAARTLGAGAMAAVVGMGVITFTLRGLLNELRQRWALRDARQMGACAEGAPGAAAEDDIPDPFAGHLLIRRPVPAPGDLFACTDNDGTVMYFVEVEPSQDKWRIKDAQENDVVRVEVEAPVGSFFMDALPGRLSVCRGSDEVARIVRRFSLAAPRVSVQCSRPRTAHYALIRDALYYDGLLVGRIYELHQSLYLDVEREAFHDAILGLFVTLS